MNLESIAEEHIRRFLDDAACDLLGVTEEFEDLTRSQAEDVIELVRNATVTISWENM